VWLAFESGGYRVTPVRLTEGSLHNVEGLTVKALVAGLLGGLFFAAIWLAMPLGTARTLVGVAAAACGVIAGLGVLGFVFEEAIMYVLYALVFTLLAPLLLFPAYRRRAHRPVERACGGPLRVPVADLAGGWFSQGDGWTTITLRHRDGSVIAYQAEGESGVRLQRAFGHLLGVHLVPHPG
jgi:hypothetical protein